MSSDRQLPRCSQCGRPLENPEAIKRGMGQRCWKKYRKANGIKRRVRTRNKPILDWRQLDLPFEGMHGEEAEKAVTAG